MECFLSVVHGRNVIRLFLFNFELIICGTYCSMRVDEGKNSWSLVAIKTKARTVVGRGKKSLLSDPGFAQRLGKGKEKDKC